MARRAITIGITHEGDKPVVVSGPEVPFTKQKTAMREVRSTRAHPQFHTIEIWSSDGGVIARKKNLTKPPAKEPAKAKSKAEGKDEAPKS
jgi:hypothetical protein